MKVLLVLLVSVAVAVARPGYLGAAHGVVPAAHGIVPAAPALVAAPHAALAAHGVHPGLAAYGPAPIAVRSDGYLADTHDVAAARAAHLTAVAQTQARDAHVNGAAAHAAPLVALTAPALPAAHGLLGAHGLAVAHGYHG